MVLFWSNWLKAKVDWTRVLETDTPVRVIDTIAVNAYLTYEIRRRFVYETRAHIVVVYDFTVSGPTRRFRLRNWMFKKNFVYYLK